MTLKFVKREKNKILWEKQTEASHAESEFYNRIENILMKGEFSQQNANPRCLDIIVLSYLLGIGTRR